MSSHVLHRVACLAMVSLFAWCGCQDQAGRAVSRPAPAPEAPAPQAPDETPPPSSDAKPHASEPPAAVMPPPKPEARRPRKPKRPVDSWAIFREAFDPKQDAACTARWTGGNRVEIRTENIQRLTIDLTQLPDGAPTKGPWNLQIDGQGIEMTGFKPKPGYTGKIRDLIRSKNGNWTVDRKRLYRIRG